MSAKLKSLKDGMLAGIAAEKTKATPMDRFALAEKAITSHPRGLLSQAAPAFSAESLAPANTSERRVIKVPLERLQENPLNARRIYDPQIVQERAASIATHGQQTPGLAAPDLTRPGWYVLIDGHYRKRALAAAGKSEMDCFIEDGLSDIDFYRLSFVLNEQRSGQSVLDNALAWRQLLDEGKVKKEEDICEITGVSAGTVNKTLALLKLPESVLEVMKERPAGIGIATGYELTLYFKSAGEDRTRELVHRVLEEGLSSRDVEQIRKVAQEGRTRKVKEVSRQYKIRSAEGDLLGTIKEWDSGRVMLDVKLGDRGARESLVEALKSRFGLDVALL